MQIVQRVSQKLLIDLTTMFLIVLVSGINVTEITAQAPNATLRTVWDGIYTADQAKRGEAAYSQSCSRCHGSSLDERLKGEGFMDRWREGSLASLFIRIRNDMPQNKPGSLSESTYLDILSLILSANGMPAGEKELDEQSLVKIRVQKKSGPEPLPDFSLVRLVGCLTRDGNNWVLSHATDPERTTDVDNSSSAELEIVKKLTLGKKTFRLQNFGYLEPDFKPEAHDGHKMQAKGTLMKLPGGDRIQLSSMQMIDLACVP